ncbi:hypothetical protein EDD16DRAFT_1722695 [Pisolithus croceorrhizus]|nr:hypothetical protein EDD16DRAFT_1722695 [Pisolithus croceorrhizus]
MISPRHKETSLTQNEQAMFHWHGRGVVVYEKAFYNIPRNSRPLGLEAPGAGSLNLKKDPCRCAAVGESHSSSHLAPRSCRAYGLAWWLALLLLAYEKYYKSQSTRLGCPEGRCSITNSNSESHSLAQLWVVQAWAQPCPMTAHTTAVLQSTWKEVGEGLANVIGN